MKRLFCLTLIACIATSAGGCGGQGKQKDAATNGQAQEKNSPKDYVIDDGQTQHDNPLKDYTNAIGMKFIWIPPGNFLLGSPKEEQGRFNTETQHRVTITKGFYMSVHTVTQEQWLAVMGNNPSRFRGETNLPVEMVTWEACQEFVKKLRQKDSKAYRLPTEAEWEYACRAGTTTPFHFGETISPDQVNYFGDFIYGNGQKGENRAETVPVGTFPANGFGLHDMHGNVAQWCQDVYGDYPQNDVVDPQGASEGTDHVVRGGSWGSPPCLCRSARRIWGEPGFGCDGVGFRLCFCLE